MFRPLSRRFRLLFRAGLSACCCLLLAACESTDVEDASATNLSEAEKTEAAQLVLKCEEAYAALAGEMEALQAKRAGEDGEDAPLPAHLREALQETVDRHEEVVDRFPGAPGADAVLYRLGLMHTALEDWGDAHEAFQKLLEWYPGSGMFHHALEREMDLARRLLDTEPSSFLGIEIGSQTSLGVEILETFLEVAPFAPDAPEALYRLGRHRFEDGSYDEAVVLFETLVRRFPGSSYRIKAEYEAARAHFKKFTGLDYDITPLEEALDRFRAFIEIHAEDDSEIARDLVGRDRGKDAPAGERYTAARGWVHLIENLLAEKNYELGEWYRGRGEEPAARSYFRFTILEYPRTPWAKKAEEKLEAMEPAGH